MNLNWLYHPGLIDLPSQEVISRLSSALREAKVDPTSAGIISGWLQSNPQRWNDWPWGVLISRMWKVYFGNGPSATAKGAKKNVVNRVMKFFSEPFGDPLLVENDAFPIPYTKPVPGIEWKRTCFQFTLPAAFGMRSDCEFLASDLGAHVNPKRRPDIVVVGFLGDYQRWGSSTIYQTLEWNKDPEISVLITTGEVIPTQVRSSPRPPIILMSEQEWLRQAIPRFDTAAMSDPQSGILF